MSSSNDLLIAPRPAHSTTHTQTSHSAPSAPGIHDTLRASLTPYTHTATAIPSAHEFNTKSSSSAQPHATSAHPLSHRLASYEQTSQNLQYALLKRNYGVAAPIIREMQLMGVRNGDAVMARELQLGPGMGLGSVNGGRGRSVHEDVLLGRDCEIEWEDVFGGGDEFAPMMDFHTAMERNMRMNW